VSFLINGLWVLFILVLFGYFIIKDIRSKKKRKNMQPSFAPEVEKEKNRHLLPTAPMDGGGV